jgi:hypothetical protein
VDWAPSDFHLFLSVKEQLKNIEIVDEDDLLDRLKELLNGICPKELDRIFATGISRVITVSKGDGSSIS